MSRDNKDKNTGAKPDSNSQKDAEKGKFARREEEILDFWNKNSIFEKTLEKDAPQGEFVFYDGPPFATGMPHYGHLASGFMKDVMPRYKTMRGYHVPRKWGWDCHGLPVENLVEQELGLSTRKDIEEYGIDRFNSACRESVMRYADEWRRIVPRLGRWVDMENDYRTMDPGFTESVWWVFKKLYDKGLIYKGFKSMHLCPRCETTLSNFEVSDNYEDITDISVTVKFKVKGEKLKFGNSDTYLLAWTTTPWTLPGNAALAVGRDILYNEYKNRTTGDRYIVAKDLATKVFDVEDGRIYKRLKYNEDEYEYVNQYRGEKLVGLEYEPVFDYYKNSDLAGKENAWKVYSADFVSVEDGTGIVHIAPAFGEDDMNLGNEHGIPMIQHVGMNGEIRSEVGPLAGLQAKPKDDPQATDVVVIKDLAHRRLLFKKEKINHSYPHCWRCDTPLLNYAASSWFVKVVDFKDKMIEENTRVGWVPPEIGAHRFGDWLEGARDWAISRSRYWGAPLPVWESADGSKRVVAGSVEDLNANRTPRNEIYVMRHGEAESNVEGVASTKVSNDHHITDKGREQVKASAKEISQEGGVDIIFSSDFKRTLESAELLAQELGLSSEQVVTDERLRETQVGPYEGRPIDEYRSEFEKPEERFTKRIEGAETLNDVKKRVGSFLYEIDARYEGKRIFIMTHGSPAWSLMSAAYGCTPEQSTKLITDADGGSISNAEYIKIHFLPLPHNEEFELDLHRPYIDEFEFVDSDGEKLQRIPEVFDCWFESGSMPYGSNYYKGDKKSSDIGRTAGTLFDPVNGKGFPADFIAEGLDQTRGWFYSMLVLSVALFGESAYKNVVVNGTVLAEDGKKMAKRLKNYPDLMLMVDRYGVDALRYYMLSSPAMRAESMNFSEGGVDEVAKKILGRLDNVVSFFETYRGEANSSAREEKRKQSNVLDHWIISRLNQLINQVTNHLDRYEFDRASRPIGEFVDDLSVWYLRRSRDRFKGADEEDKRVALETTRYVLETLAKVMAPFTPFMAEEIYQKVKPLNSKTESVHLDNWPQAGIVDDQILKQMEEVRKTVSFGLEKRSASGIKVRQPLARLKIRNAKFEMQNNQEFLNLIKEEVNVKEVVIDKDLKDEVELDTEITPELREEGSVRELIRAVQDLRKKAGLNPGDKTALSISTDDAGRSFVENHSDELKAATGLSEIKFEENSGAQIVIDGKEFTLALS